MSKVQEKSEIGLQEAVFLASIIVIALFMWFSSYGKREVVSLFPQIVCIIILCLAIYRVLGMFIAYRRGVKLVRSSDDDDESFDFDSNSTNKEGTLNIYQSVILLLSYFLIMYIFGFYLATFVYLVASQYLLKGLNLVKALIFSSTLTLSLYFLFKVVLVFMPQGLIFS